VVHADGVAVWSERREGDREKVLLERGTLWMHVDHGSGEGRLLVVLPDGELEDIGTTFTVRAEDGRTKRVTLEEGHVLLRLRDRPALTIGAGETWLADVPAPVACASVEPSTEPPAAPLGSSAPVGSAAAPDPSAEFRAAMSALDVGDDRDAAAKFGSYLQRHPRDPRAEDAAYLRVIALQRCGDAGGMKEAATTYLRLYPAGFRRAEVEPLAR
jgi:TolA-binding protein